MAQTTYTETMAFGEFVTLMALMMSLVALSIDAMLPALTQIGNDLNVVKANDNQLIISLLFLGFAIGMRLGTLPVLSPFLEQLGIEGSGIRACQGKALSDFTQATSLILRVRVGAALH